ncbi:MAG: Smr/MutS family protein, partial [Bacteroidota bacterium]
EAQAMIRQANKEIERTIREIRESQAEKARTKRLRKELAKAAPEMTEEEKALPSIPATNKRKGKEKAASKPVPAGPVLMPDAPLEVGSWVKMRKSETTGQLAEIQGKRGVLLAGQLKVQVKLDQLVRIQPPKAKKKKAAAVQVVSNEDDLPPAVRWELDVLGKRVEEALPKVDRWLDDLRMSGLREGRILHGKGTGILRDSIRRHLTGYAFVAQLSDAPVEQGGAGWTLVKLRP